MAKEINRKDITIIILLTIIIAFMEITGIPSVLFFNIQVVDIDPMYFALMINFILIGVLSFLVLKFLCPNWNLRLKVEGTVEGLKKYGFIGLVALVTTTAAFYIGLRPFDIEPSVWKVLIEGFIYYIGIGIIEELYVRGFLLNVIEKLFYKRKNATIIAILLSSLFFGFGHIFGVVNQSILVIVSKIVWTVCMGIYFRRNI